MARLFRYDLPRQPYRDELVGLSGTGLRSHSQSRGDTSSRSASRKHPCPAQGPTAVMIGSFDRFIGAGIRDTLDEGSMSKLKPRAENFLPGARFTGPTALSETQQGSKQEKSIMPHAVFSSTPCKVPSRDVQPRQPLKCATPVNPCSYRVLIARRAGDRICPPVRFCATLHHQSMVV